MTINKKAEFSFIVSDLFDTTLEMRRFEKNYFLYGHKEDYSENLRFTERSEDIIKNNKEAIEKLAIKADVYALDTDIREYKSLMQKYFEQDKRHAPMETRTLEERIREIGKKIVTSTEAISVAERKYMQTLIERSQRILIFSGIFLIIAGFFIAEYLTRMVIRPLKLLEESMQKIANGEFSFIPVLSRDKELLSLSKAINTMLVELEMRQRHLVQSEKLASIGTLLFGVAHEINNPLSNISTSCQILKEEIEEADIEYKRELLSQIEAETDRAKDIVRTVLEFSRAGKKENVNLKNAVNESLRLIKGEIPSKIEIRMEVPDDIVLFADKQKLQQVFLNLIKNSMGAIEGEGKVFISAKKGKGNIIEIEVRDTGIGMEPEIVSKIFEPFFTKKDTKKGYGLGLFVVHNIIEKHGGTIDVESQVGYGTTFLIRLPLKERKDEE
ncbi:MAG: HAMP domain-containing sensor histidine kinase [Thermodesulfovibrionia bacterium]|nr:HAMP domain-containing sensor histidine kinase [Thermodesulfovibrionia bacterium]